MKFLKSPTFWHVSMIANIMWATHSAMFAVFSFNTEGQERAGAIFALASLIHSRLIFYCQDKWKELKDK